MGNVVSYCEPEEVCPIFVHLYTAGHCFIRTFQRAVRLDGETGAQEPKSCSVGYSCAFPSQDYYVAIDLVPFDIFTVTIVYSRRSPKR